MGESRRVLNGRPARNRFGPFPESRVRGRQPSRPGRRKANTERGASSFAGRPGPLKELSLPAAVDGSSC